MLGTLPLQCYTYTTDPSTPGQSLLSPSLVMQHHQRAERFHFLVKLVAHSLPTLPVHPPLGKNNLFQLIVNFFAKQQQQQQQQNSDVVSLSSSLLCHLQQRSYANIHPLMTPHDISHLLQMRGCTRFCFCVVGQKKELCR